MATKKVLCLLQNQWFRDPERACKLLEMYQKKEGPNNGRARFVRDMLFMGCLTGRRIEKAFGDALCDYDGVVFEDASADIYGDPRTKPAPDPIHVETVLRWHEPTLVVTLGEVALKSLQLANVARFMTIRHLHGPHPAARGAKVYEQLAELGKKLREYLDDRT